ncbi:MAG TPA: pyridoxal-phosphate dependent enzyme [Vicinamibacterales bacterium]|nr:pyridoxal-phosphate dependent enzyme [Vicinamibacterales bacterium]
MSRTPLRRSPWLSAASGGEVLLKLETLQPTFSFKIRGALNAVMRTVEERKGKATGSPPALVTASAGNHGRAMAFAAARAHVPLTVYVPRSAPRTKLEAMRASGADVRPCADYDEAERAAKAHTASGHAEYISPYSHPDVIAGAATIGLEILEDRPDIDCILAPLGGGGLVSGIVIAASRVHPRTSVAGVEVEASCPFTQGLAAGRIVPVTVGETLADGLAGNLDPDTVTFEIVRDLVAQVVCVDEAGLREAVAGIVRHERLVVEAAGAAGVAAVLGGRFDARNRRVAVVLSGANIDADKLAAILAISAEDTTRPQRERR